jgi:hypothetical protein
MKKELKKAKALKLMKEMDIYKDYIDEFESSDKVCFFERFGGYYVEDETELANKIKSIESRYKCMVYAITHEYADFGECYSFLVVTNYREEWDDLVYSNGNEHSAFAYVWNKTDNDCSEFGSVLVQSFGGGIRRIA